MNSLSFLRSHVGTVVSVLVILPLWEWATKIFAIPVYILPPPTLVVRAMVERWEALLNATWWTFQEVIIGFLLAALIGILLGTAIVLSPVIERLLYPPMVIIQAIPKIALAPLFLVWLGYGATPKVAITFLIAFFPVVMDTITGLRSIDPNMIQLARSMGAHYRSIFIKFRFPNALPNIMSGLKVASVLAVVGALTGEFVGTDRGLGYIMLQATGLLDTAVMFAALIMVTLIAMVIFYMTEGIERLIIPWHVSQRNK